MNGMDMNLLKYFMGRHGDNQAELAKALGLPQSALSERMNGRRSFRQNEMDTIRKRYGLTAQDMQNVFFAS